MTRNEHVAEELNLFAERRSSRKEKSARDDEYAKDTEDSPAHLGHAPCEGSDSGVEMTGRCCHCRTAVTEADSETDSCQMGSSNGHSPSMYFSADMSDLVSSTIRKLSVGEAGGGENSPMSYDAASENGSESSSVDDSKKSSKSHCAAAISKLSAYCSKGGRRQAAPPGRSKASPFPNDSLKFASSTTAATINGKPSSSVASKCAALLSIHDSAADAAKCSKLPVTEVRSRGLRSCSVTRTRTPVSPDETGGNHKWLADTRLSRTRLLPTGGVSERITTFDTYATLPRRKHRDVTEQKNSPRDPSLNRAASLRKKFLENSLMTTSLNASIGSSSPSTKTLPPYVKARPTKTKIYHEVASQTSLTNGDVDHALSNHPFSIYNDLEIQAEAEYRIKKRYEEQMSSVNEELKKLKKENGKQKTIIEWLEGELAAAKDEKFALQNKYTSIEQRVYSLLRHKGTREDVFHQLEREVSSSNHVIAQQQEEITELQQMCCVLKRDLDRSYSTQKTILEAQKASEVESLELQEFMQAEKSTLTDSLKDIEQELTLCRTRLVQKEQELTKKQSEFETLEAISEQLRQEKQTLKARLSSLERRSRELLLHQGAVISSASVALSGLGSRFDQLLDQLVTAYDISNADLQDDCQNEICSRDDGDRSGGDKSKRPITDSGRANSSIPWLKAIRNIISRTSAEKRDSCEGSKSSTISVVSKRLLESNVTSRSSMADSRTSVTSSSADETIPTDKRNSSILNLISSDDALYLSRLDLDSRRDSILSDTYVTDDNLTLDFTINESLNDLLSGKHSLDNGDTLSFLKDYTNRDVSLVEQVIEVDNLVTKVFKALLIALCRSPGIIEKQMEVDGKRLTEGNVRLENGDVSTSTLSNGNDYPKQNGFSVPDGGSNAIAFVRLQHKTVNNLLLVLHQMQDAVDGSTILKKIQSDLQDVDRMCNSFLSTASFDTAV